LITILIILIVVIMMIDCLYFSFFVRSSFVRQMLYVDQLETNSKDLYIELCLIDVLFIYVITIIKLDLFLNFTKMQYTAGRVRLLIMGVS
jgi:hypothetical protein